MFEVLSLHRETWWNGTLRRWTKTAAVNIVQHRFNRKHVSTYLVDSKAKFSGMLKEIQWSSMRCVSLEWKPSRQTMLRCFQIRIFCEVLKELRSIQDACKQFFLANYQAWWSQVVAHPQIPQISSAWRCRIFKEVILILRKLKFPQVPACSESLTFNSRYFWSIS